MKVHHEGRCVPLSTEPSHERKSAGVDPLDVWNTAFDLAVERGNSNREAARQADLAVTNLETNLEP